MTISIRRVVTGFDEQGRSMIVSDSNPPADISGSGKDQRTIVEVFSTIAEPVPEGAAAPVTTGLGPNATEIRIVEMAAGCFREMHRTDTVDYGLVLSGELHVVLERGETVLRTGDIIVQRGTNHAWHNRSDAPVRMAFINMSGQTTDRKRCPDVP